MSVPAQLFSTTWFSPQRVSAEMSYQNVVTSTTLDDRDLGNITYAGNRPWTVHSESLDPPRTGLV